MELLNRLPHQLRDIFRSMSPGGRLLAALLAALIAISIVWLVRFRSAESYEYLLGGQHFSRREVEAMEVAFANQGLSGSEVAGQQIRIPRGRKQEFLAALGKENALPERFDPDEMLLDGGLLEPRDVREERQRIAGQNKLAMLIEKMPGIEDASIRIDEVRVSSFPQRIEKRAIALVSASGRRPLLPEEIDAIRDTVVGFIAGIDREHVTVTDLEAMRAYPGDGERPGADDANRYANAKRIFETMWRDKIAERLQYYKGVVVAVNVELEQTDKSSREPQPDSESLSAARAVGNLPLAIGTDEITRQTTAVDERQSTLAAASSLTPTRVTASIDVPRSFIVELWKQANPSASQHSLSRSRDPAALARIELQTHATIEQAVKNLLPLWNGDATTPQVIVTTYDDLSTVGRHAWPQSSVAEWLEARGPMIAALSAAVLGLWFMGRRLRRKRPGKEHSVNPRRFQQVQSFDVRDEDDFDESWSPVDEADASPTPADLRRQLRDLVNTDPDAAADALRAWIGDAA